MAVIVEAVEPIDPDEEPGEGLARAGGRGHQRVTALRDERPGLRLGRGRTVGKTTPEPLGHRGMEAERVGTRLGQAQLTRRPVGRGVGRREAHAAILPRPSDTHPGELGA